MMQSPCRAGSTSIRIAIVTTPHLGLAGHRVLIAVSLSRSANAGGNVTPDLSANWLNERDDFSPHRWSAPV